MCLLASSGFFATSHPIPEGVLGPLGTESVFGQRTAGEETPIVQVASCVGGFQPRLDHTMVRRTRLGVRGLCGFWLGTQQIHVHRRQSHTFLLVLIRIHRLIRFHLPLGRSASLQELLEFFSTLNIGTLQRNPALKRSQCRKAATFSG